MKAESMFKSFPVLQCSPYILRSINQNDYKEIFEIYSDKENAKYASKCVYSNTDEAKDYIDRVIERYNNKENIRWAICEKDSNKLIGIVSIHNINYEKEEGHIGYVLNKKYWGKGITSQCVKGVVDFLLNEIGFKKLEASISPYNKASIGVIGKVGFEKKEVAKRPTYTGEYKERIIFCKEN